MVENNQAFQELKDFFVNRELPAGIQFLPKTYISNVALFVNKNMALLTKNTAGKKSIILKYSGLQLLMQLLSK